MDSITKLGIVLSAFLFCQPVMADVTTLQAQDAPKFPVLISSGTQAQPGVSTVTATVVLLSSTAYRMDVNLKITSSVVCGFYFNGDSTAIYATAGSEATSAAVSSVGGATDRGVILDATAMTAGGTIDGSIFFQQASGATTTRGFHTAVVNDTSSGTRSVVIGFRYSGAPITSVSFTCSTASWSSPQTATGLVSGHWEIWQVGSQHN